MYGFLKKCTDFTDFLKKNCTDCTDFFSKIIRIVRISSENVRIFVRMGSKKFWPPLQSLTDLPVNDTVFTKLTVKKS